MAATSGPAGTTVELALAAPVVSHHGHGCFLLRSFPVIIGSGCRAVGWKTMRNRNDDMDNKDNDNDNKRRHTMMLRSIIMASRGVHVVASPSSLSSAAADDDDNAPDSVGIYCHHHCSHGNNNEATRVLRRCASKGRGEATINLGDGIVACHQWSFPRLHCGCCSHCFFVVVVGCRGCVILSRGFCSCIVVVVVGCCSCAVFSHSCVMVVAVALLLPAVVSLFPVVGMWLLQSLWLLRSLCLVSCGCGWLLQLIVVP